MGDAPAYIHRLTVLIHGGNYEDALQLNHPSGLDGAMTVKASLLRSRAYTEIGKHREALRESLEAVRIDPKNPRVLASCGVAYELLGDRTNALQMLQAGTTEPQKDVSKACRRSTEFDQIHGQEQVARLIAQFESLKPWTESSSAIRRHLIEGFGGRNIGGPVDWDPSVPILALAEHQLPEGDLHAIIRVSPVFVQGRNRGKKLNGSQLLASVIFELFNLENCQCFASIRSQAEDGLITRQEYVRRCIALELAAIDRTRRFYVSNILSQSKGLLPDSSPVDWMCLQWNSIEDYVEDRINDPRAYPWQPFGLHYDMCRGDGLVRSKRYDDAIGYFRAVEEYGSPVQSESASIALTEALILAERHIEAADAVQRGLKLSPESIELRLLSAEINIDFLADVSKAKLDIAIVLKKAPDNAIALQLLKVAESKSK